MGVAEEIGALLGKMKELLSGCDCDGACHKCLKHYRNQYIHGMLDRFAALELLEWGVKGTIVEALPAKTQQSYIRPLENILNESGCSLFFNEDDIVINPSSNPKRLVVYPAMWIEPHQNGTVFVSDAFMKFAKPYAVQKIIAETYENSPRSL